MLINLRETAAQLPLPWKSTIVGSASGANLKVLRMDGRTYAPEAHEYAEALIVLDGCMNLSIEDRMVAVKAGEMFLVPSRVLHGVADGSHGTLLIVDQITGA
ncbi:cupin domain-containing protein [Oxalobacteraceae bacterium OM1]|nr:cupin domain-containing protein [Oxalobacteraceae bacterium OM1]